MTTSEHTPSNQEEYLYRIFEEGKAFTKKVLQENAELRAAIARLREQVRSGAELDDVPGDADLQVKRKYQAMAEAYRELLERYKKLEQDISAIKTENVDFAQKYVEIEEQNTGLANLYVASYQLHSTLVFEEVVGAVVDIVINLVGAERLGVYIFDTETERLECVGQEGLSAAEAKPIVVGEGILGKVASLGESYYVVSEEEQRVAEKKGQPIACIPLKIKDRLVGVVCIYRLLRQKDGFSSMDFQLFDLLAGHAATALYSSRLYALSERKLATARSFLSLLKIKPNEF